MPEVEAITLYAHWVAKTVLVTFNAMGGAIDAETKEVVFDAKYGELPVPTYKGFTFVDWYLDIEGKNKIDKDTIVATEYDHILYAYWVKDVKTISELTAMHFGKLGINPANGNISLSSIDMVMNIANQNYELKRTYNSKNVINTLFGRGWTFSFEANCELFDDGAIVSLPDGSSHIFRLVDDKYKAISSYSTFALDEEDNIYRLTETDQTIYGFNSDGTLAFIQDRNKNQTKVSYANGMISKLTDPVGRVYHIETNHKGHITKITNPLGDSIIYAYNEDDLLTFVTNLVGGITTYEYNGQGYLSKIIDPNNNVIQDFQYSKRFNDEDIVVTKSIDSYGGIWTYEYSYETNQTKVKGQDNREWIYFYNDAMFITDVQNPDGSMSKTEYFENEEGTYFADIKSSTDEYGNKTSYEVDDNGNITKIIYCDDSEERFVYDKRNNIITEIDEVGSHTYYCYDDDGINLLKKVQRLDGSVINVTPDNILEVLSSIDYDDPNYIVEEYDYYSIIEATQKFNCVIYGLLESITNPEGEISKYTYDRYGNTATRTNEAGRKTEYSHDLMGNKLKEITPNGYEYSWRYDANGFVTREYYPDEGIAVSAYDLAGHLTKTVSQELYQADNDFGNYYSGDEGTNYEYNPSGRLEKVTDALGHITSFEYDTYGNIVSETRESSTTTYEYDNRDRMVKQMYRETHDSANVLMKELEYLTLPVGEQQITTKLYSNENNKIIQVTVNDNRGRKKEEYILVGEDKKSQKLYTYNLNGSLATETAADGSTTYYYYDAKGNIAQKFIPSIKKDGKTYYTWTGYTYDRVDRLIQESLGSQFVDKTDSLSSPISSTYDTTYVYTNGLLTEQTEPSGLKTTYTYDKEGNVIRTQVGEGTVEGSTAYITETSYDNRKNPVSVIKYIRRGDLYGNDFTDMGLTHAITSYLYDKEGRVISEIEADGITTSYTYDGVGNQTSISKPVLNNEGIETGIYTKSAEYNRDGNATKVIDSYGATTNLTYDNRGNLIKLIDSLGGVTLYQYDNNDRMTVEVSPKNYVAGKPITQMPRSEYEYDSTGKLITQTDYIDENGSLVGVVTKSYTYDELGNVTKKSDAYGKGAQYTYHPNGMIDTERSAIDVDNGNGISTYYTYDVYGNVARVQRMDYVVNYTYDAMGKLLSAKDSIGDIATYTYDGLGRLITKTDGNGNNSRFTYNALGSISIMRKPGDSSIGELTSYIQYDINGREKATYDTASNRVDYKYDSLGNIIEEKTTDTVTSDCLISTYGYDLNSNLISSIDAVGTLTTMSYDSLGRLKEQRIHKDILSQDAKITTYDYDANGNSISKTDWLGNTTTNVYDSRNRLIAEYDALGNLISANTYDYNGRQTSAVDAIGNTTLYTYDAGSNVSSLTDPLNATTTNVYDNKNNLISTTDALGHTTRYIYDGRNRMIGVIDSIGGTTVYVYDNANNLIQQKDSGGNRISYTYNTRNMLASRQDIGTEAAPILDAPIELYTYTSDEKISIKTDRNGLATNYTYDGFGRLQSEQAGSDVKAYTYDNVGNVLTMTDISGITTRIYDNEGRVLSKTVPQIGSVNYQYDINVGSGEVKDTTLTPDGVITETTYDAVGRIKRVGSYTSNYPEVNQETVHYVYNTNGSRQATVYADGTREDYIYDAAGRVLSLIHTDRYGATLDQYSYTYDLVGNLLTETSNRGTIQYSYDGNGRILSVLEPDGKLTEYTYDTAGNRATKQEGYIGIEPIFTGYTYDASNRLITQQSSVGDLIYYSYDANGNLISETGSIGAVSGSAIGFDAADESEIYIEPDISNTVNGLAINIEEPTSVNVLDNNKELPTLVNELALRMDISAVSGSAINMHTSLTVSGAAITIDKVYYYDGFNRLIEFRQGDTIAHYTYNAENYRVRKTVSDVFNTTDIYYYYEGGKVLLEANGTGDITARNSYGTHLVSRTTPSGSYYYLYNAHGDVVMLIDVYSGGTAATYQYDAFGTIISQTGYADNSITYGGYQYDKESGLYYLNSRYYNSTTGRFLTEDTYIGRMGDPLSLNRYTYCHNNPIRYTDSSGHAVFSTLLASFVIGAVIGGAVEYVSQKVTNKKAKTNWKAVTFEAFVGGVSGLIGGGIGTSVAKGAAKTAAKKTAKTVVKEIAKGALKTGLTEAAIGFVADVGKQVIVDDKNIDEVDLGQAAKTAAVSGISGAVGHAIGAGIQEVGSNLTSKAAKHLDEATDVVDDIIDTADDSVVAITNNLDTALSSKPSSTGANIAPPTKTPGNNSIDLSKQTMNQTQNSGSGKMNLQFFAEEGKDAIEGGSQAQKTFIDMMEPDEAARYQRYWEQDYKPTFKGEPNTRQRLYTVPGERSIKDIKINSKTGETYVRETIYDEFGRRIGNNDFTNHGRPDVPSHTNPHHHPNPWYNPNQHGPGTPGLHSETPRR